MPPFLTEKEILDDFCCTLQERQQVIFIGDRIELKGIPGQLKRGQLGSARLASKSNRTRLLQRLEYLVYRTSLMVKRLQVIQQLLEDFIRTCQQTRMNSMRDTASHLLSYWI